MIRIASWLLPAAASLAKTWPAALAAAIGVRGVHCQQPGGAGAGNHFAQFELDALVIGDGFADCMVFLQVMGGEAQEAYGQPESARRRVYAAKLKPASYWP